MTDSEAQDFKVTAYRLETGQISFVSFEDSMKHAFSRSFEERLVLINGRSHRLEHLDVKGEYLLANFTTLAYSGPGRTEQDTAAAPIDLAPTESFTFETAMLCDETNSLVLLESSRNGIGANAVTDYFEKLAPGRSDYSLAVLLDNDAASRARRFATISRLSMRVAIGPVTSADRAAGIGVLKALGENYGAELIDVELSISRLRRTSLIPDRVWNLVDALKPRENEDITELELTGKRDEEAPTELIDLIHHRQRRVRTLTIDEHSRNVPHEKRWEALIDIRNEFVSYE